MLFLDIPSCVGMHSSPFTPFLLEREREEFKSRLYVNSFVFLLCFMFCWVFCWMLFVISFLIVLQALHSLRYGEP